jgi:hypothetical protein
MIPFLSMRKGIRRWIVALVVLAGIGGTACVSGDVDEEKPVEHVPSGITPESASFHIEARHDTAQQALVVRLSTLSLCNRTEVPLDHPFVELELTAPAGAQFATGDCRLDQTLRCRIRIARTTTPECASAAGTYAAAGHLQIDEITEDVVRGSFVGTSIDSKLDLQGSFVAHRCEGSESCP